MSCTGSPAFGPDVCGKTQGAIRSPGRVQRARRVASAVAFSGNRERPAALRARNPHHAVRQVDLIPAQVEQAAASQARVRRQHDLLFQIGRRRDRASGVQQAVVLLARQIPKPRVVLMEQLHAAHGIGTASRSADAPVEERLQDRQILVDRAARDLLCALQLERLRPGWRDLRQRRLRRRSDCLPARSDGSM